MIKRLLFLIVLIPLFGISQEIIVGDMVQLDYGTDTTVVQLVKNINPLGLSGFYAITGNDTLKILFFGDSTTINSNMTLLSDLYLPNMNQGNIASDTMILVYNYSTGKLSYLHKDSLGFSYEEDTTSYLAKYKVDSAYREIHFMDDIYVHTVSAGTSNDSAVLVRTAAGKTVYRYPYQLGISGGSGGTTYWELVGTNNLIPLGNTDTLGSVTYVIPKMYLDSMAYQVHFTEGLELPTNKHLILGDDNTYILGNSDDDIDVYVSSVKVISLNSDSLFIYKSIKPGASNVWLGSVYDKFSGIYTQNLIDDGVDLYIMGLTSSTIDDSIVTSDPSTGKLDYISYSRLPFASISHTHSYDNYQYWIISDNEGTPNTENINSTNTVKFAGAGIASTLYNTSTNILTINAIEVDGNTSNELQDLSWDILNHQVDISDGTSATIPLFDGSKNGLVPKPTSTNNYFLRDDGTWQSVSSSDEYVDNISFNTADGVLTLERAVGSDLTQDLDGRYSLNGHTHSYDNYQYWNISDNEGTPNTENVNSTNTVKFAGAGIASTIYNTVNNTLTITATEVDGSTSNELQNLTYDAVNGHVELSDGTDADIGMFSTSNSNYGLVPGSNGATTSFLRGDGTWQSVSGGTDDQNLTWDATNGYIEIEDGNDADIGSFSTINANYGFVIGSNGNTTYFLRGDNTWQDISSSYDNYNYWVILDNEGTPNTENVYSTNQVKFSGSGIVSTLYSPSTNTLTITGTEVDGSTSNELQDLGFTASTGTITISSGTNTTIGSFSTANTNYGFTPGSNGATTSFLRGDGTWVIPSSGTDDQNLTWDATNGHIEIEDGTDADIGMFSTSGTGYGFVRGSNSSGNDYYLRADGTWAIPSGTGSGEANTASNLGSGIGIYENKSGVDLQFNSIVSQSTDQLTLYEDDANNEIDFTINTGSVTDGASTLSTGNQIYDFVTGQGYLTTEVDGSVTNELQDLSWDALNHQVDISDGGTSATIPLFNGSNDGLVPKPTSASNYFLRDDGTWQPVIVSDEYVDGVSFNISDGILTLSRAVGSDLTQDLDGRYSLDGHTHSYDNYQYWNISDGSTNENINSTNSLVILGSGISTTSYNTVNNTLTITTTEVDGSTSNELQDLSYDAANGHVELSNGNDADIGSFGTANANYGLVVGSNGATTSFLRGDNTWQDISSSYDNYQYWTISDAEGTPNTENISSTSTVKFEGSGIVSTLYSPSTNTLTITATEVDGSTSNELQDLSYTTSTRTIGITGGDAVIISTSSVADDGTALATGDQIYDWGVGLFEPKLTKGNLTSGTTNQLTVTNGNSSVMGDGVQLNISTASVSNGGTSLATGDQIYDFVTGYLPAGSSTGQMLYWNGTSWSSTVASFLSWDPTGVGTLELTSTSYSNTYDLVSDGNFLLINRGVYFADNQENGIRGSNDGDYLFLGADLATQFDAGDYNLIFSYNSTRATLKENTGDNIIIGSRQNYMEAAYLDTVHTKKLITEGGISIGGDIDLNGNNLNLYNADISIEPLGEDGAIYFKVNDEGSTRVSTVMDGTGHYVLIWDTLRVNDRVRIINPLSSGDIATDSVVVIDKNGIFKRVSLNISGSGVSEVTSSTTNQLTVANGTTTPALSIVTATVTDGGTSLATGDQINDFVVGKGYIDEVVDDATPQLGGYLDLNDNGYTLELTAGETLAAGDLCCFKNSDGEMYLADADAVVTSGNLLAICLETSLTDGNSGTFLIKGIYTSSSLTNGIQYVSTTAGEIVGTAPSGTGDIVRIVGYNISATKFFFDPDQTYITLN